MAAANGASSGLDLELLKSTVAKGLTDPEFALFAHVCTHRALDPFAKQIYAIKRWDGRSQKEVMTVQTSIDGFRLIAQRTGEYCGQTPKEWCDSAGVWHDVWLDEKKPPFAARVGIYRAGFTEPLFALAYWAEYVQTDKAGKPSGAWKSRGISQLAKCAEALGLRGAFAEELSGLYTDDEAGQGDVKPKDAPRPARAAGSPSTVFAPPDQSEPPIDTTATETAAEAPEPPPAEATPTHLSDLLASLEGLTAAQAKTVRDGWKASGLPAVKRIKLLADIEAARALIETAIADTTDETGELVNEDQLRAILKLFERLEITEPVFQASYITERFPQYTPETSLTAVQASLLIEHLQADLD